MKGWMKWRRVSPATVRGSTANAGSFDMIESVEEGFVATPVRGTFVFWAKETDDR